MKGKAWYRGHGGAGWEHWTGSQGSGSSPASGPPGCVTLASDLPSLGCSNGHTRRDCDSTKENSFIHRELEVKVLRLKNCNQEAKGAYLSGISM